MTLVKVFSATTARARALMGDQIAAWLAAHPSVTVLDTIVTTSSDRCFHCLSIVLLCAAPGWVNAWAAVGGA
jgi:hypothetical protein